MCVQYGSQLSYFAQHVCQERVMVICTERYNPSVEGSEPEVEVVEAARFPPGVHLTWDALQPAPPSQTYS
jgi:hypothetical protein